MEILQKFSLSILIAFLLFSCKDTSKEDAADCVFFAGNHYQGTQTNINALAKAIELDSTNVEAWRELSIPFLKRGMPHLWKKYMDRAIELDPIVWQGYRGYNYLWFYRDYKKAIADFDATDTLTPNFIDNPQGHSVDYWRGIAYLGLKDYKNSIAYFDKHIQKEIEESGEDWVEHEAFLYRGIAYYEAGKLEHSLALETKHDTLALKDFNTLLKYNSDFADVKYFKASILFDQCIKLAAKIDFEQKMRGNNSRANFMSFTFKEKHQEALNLINEAIENFNNGYSDQRPYVETIRQLYIQDYENLKAMLEAMK